MFKYTALILGLFGLSFQSTLAKTSGLQVQGFTTIFTYAKENLKLELINTQAKIRIEGIQVHEPIKWIKGCKDIELDTKAKCEFEIGFNGTEYPLNLVLNILTESGDVKIERPLQQINNPLDQWFFDQESELSYLGQYKDLIHFPFTKIGTQGEKIKVHLKSQHFKNLKIKKISAPEFYTVDGCEGKLIESFLTAKDDKKIHCAFEISYNPKKETDVNGEMTITLEDNQRQYTLTSKLKASPWRPMYAKKVLASEYDTYVLLSDSTLWIASSKVGWKLVWTNVDDFFLGPKKGLAVKVGNKILAQFQKSIRFGKMGENNDSAKPLEWIELIKNAKDISLAEHSSYYRDEAGNIWEIGHNVMDYEDQQQKKLPFHYDVWTKLDKKFKSLFHEKDGLFGIDENNDLWFRGAFDDIKSDGVYETQKSKGWEKIDSQISQFEVCGNSIIKLKTNGDLYAKGSNYSGIIGLQKNGIIPMWTLANKEVKEFRIDCNTGFSTHGHTKILVIKNDNTLWGQGLNRQGQLGSIPKQDSVSNWQKLASDVKSVTHIEDRVLFLKSDGSVWATGSHSFDLSRLIGRPPLGSVTQLGDIKR